MDIRFGNLTTQYGQKANFDDLDRNGDGIISKREYYAALREYDFDSVDIRSTSARNNGRAFSHEDYQIMEQKMKMEESLQSYLQRITWEFTGSNSQYAYDMNAALWEYLDTFALEYEAENESVSNMAQAFSVELPSKYAQLKNLIINQEYYSNLKSRVLDRVVGSSVNEAMYSFWYKAPEITNGVEGAMYADGLGTMLEAEADAFIANYRGYSLEYELENHLRSFMNSTDTQLLQNDIYQYQRDVYQLGPYVDRSELENLQDAAKRLLFSALEKGIEVPFGCDSKDTVSSMIDGFSNPLALKAMMQDFINTLSGTTVKEKALDNAKSGMTEMLIGDLWSTGGPVNPSEIYYGDIPFINNWGYSTHSASGRDGETSADKMENNLTDILNSSSLKYQIKQQVMGNLLQYGIPADKIENIFENMYTASVIQTVESGAAYGTRGRWGYNTSFTDVSSVVSMFIENFNVNIMAALGEAGSSWRDMDMVDVDYRQGLEYSSYGRDVIDAMENNDDVDATTRNGAKRNAENLIENLRGQMQQKAQELCSANGVSFRSSQFNSIFKQAKKAAVASSVQETDNSNGYSRRYTYNPNELFTAFSAIFTESYTGWVYGQRR